MINRYKFLVIDKILIYTFSIKVASLRMHYKVDKMTSFWETIITFSGERECIKQTPTNDNIDL